MAMRAAALPGGAEFFSAWHQAADDHKQGSDAPPEPAPLKNYQPKFVFTEILIPTDDTPGAREAHCAHSMDYLLHAADEAPAMQKQWRAMAALRRAGFHAGDAKARALVMEEMSRPERDRSGTHLRIA